MTPPTVTTPLLGLRGLPASGGFLWRTGALFVATGMLAGAFGSHGLKSRPGMTPDKLSAFSTASHYAVFNGLGLLLVASHPRFAAHRFAGPAIALGGLVFSSTIWALTLDRDRFRRLGPVTPMGGLLMIAGYVSLIF